MKTVAQVLAVVATILLVVAVSAPSAVAQAPRELDRSLLIPSDADIAAGKTLATTACGSCHGLDGISIDPTLPHLAGQPVIYLYDELNAYKRGDREDESMSKAIEFLSDDAFRKVSIYYASLVPPSPAVGMPKPCSPPSPSALTPASAHVPTPGEGETSTR